MEKYTSKLGLSILAKLLPTTLIVPLCQRSNKINGKQIAENLCDAEKLREETFAYILKRFIALFGYVELVINDNHHGKQSYQRFGDEE